MKYRIAVKCEFQQGANKFATKAYRKYCTGQNYTKSKLIVALEFEFRWAAIMR